MALEHINPKPALMGIQLGLTDEQRQKYKVIYKSAGNGPHEFAGIYNPDIPDEEYPDGTIALPIESVFGGTKILYAGTAIYNVEGSTKDPWYNKDYPNHENWVDIWQENVKSPGYTPVKKCYVKNDKETCDRRIIGGHVVEDETKIHPHKGDNGVVYIVPICNSHNHRKGKMVICENVQAMVLDKYFQKG